VPRTSSLEPPTEDRNVLGFGDRIREVRRAAGLSQNQVMRRARPFLANGTLTRIEAGSRKDVRLSTLWALAAALSLRVTVTPEGIEIGWLDAST
jgi:transcriptional regulator with XRE-family HTH domain